jgi:hypothetical protein
MTIPTAKISDRRSVLEIFRCDRSIDLSIGSDLELPRDRPNLKITFDRSRSLDFGRSSGDLNYKCSWRTIWRSDFDKKTAVTVAICESEPLRLLAFELIILNQVNMFVAKFDTKSIALF